MSQAHMVFKKQHSFKNHNLTQENWDEIYAAQGGVCKLCGGEPTGEKYHRLVIDHSTKCCEYIKGTHYAPGARSCGKCIRGLLCRGCNLMVAGYENAIGILDILDLEKYCATEFFVFSTPLWDQMSRWTEHSPKLDMEKARKIRRLRAEGRTLQSLADQFGVVHTTISKIVHNKNYVEN